MFCDHLHDKREVGISSLKELLIDLETSYLKTKIHIEGNTNLVGNIDTLNNTFP